MIDWLNFILPHFFGLVWFDLIWFALLCFDFDENVVTDGFEVIIIDIQIIVEFQIFFLIIDTCSC